MLVPPGLSKASASAGSIYTASRRLSKALEKLHAHRLAGAHRPALVLEHDEAVRLRHRAQDARTLLAGGPRLPLSVVPEQHPALVLRTPRHLAHVFRRRRAQERNGVIVGASGKVQECIAHELV